MRSLFGLAFQAGDMSPAVQRDRQDAIVCKCITNHIQKAQTVHFAQMREQRSDPNQIHFWATAVDPPYEFQPARGSRHALRASSSTEPPRPLCFRAWRGGGAALLLGLEFRECGFELVSGFHWAALSLLPTARHGPYLLPRGCRAPRHLKKVRKAIRVHQDRQDRLDHLG